MHRALHKGAHPRSHATREAILAAALTIFARDGFSGARMEDIAQAAGYNKALLFHYFDDKLGLYRALMARTKELLFARFDAAVEEILLAPDALSAAQLTRLVHSVVDAIFEAYTQQPEIARIMAWEAAEGWQAFTACAPALGQSWSERIALALLSAQRRGIVRPEVDPYLLFTTVMSLPLIHMVSLQRFAVTFPDRDFQSSTAIAHARDHISRMLLHGILTPSKEGTLEA